MRAASALFWTQPMIGTLCQARLLCACFRMDLGHSLFTERSVVSAGHFHGLRLGEVDTRDLGIGRGGTNTVVLTLIQSVLHTRDAKQPAQQHSHRRPCNSGRAQPQNSHGLLRATALHKRSAAVPSSANKRPSVVSFPARAVH